MRLHNNSTIDITVKLLMASVAMFAFVFVVMVPLYDVLCDALGINGKTSGTSYVAEKIEVDTTREITVQFVTINNSGMPWIFKPSEVITTVNPGAMNDVTFYAKNTTSNDMSAQAIPSVSPSRASTYFHKTECFCFDKQDLTANTETNMPLRYIVDQDLPRDIQTITLSYTIFDITD